MKSFCCLFVSILILTVNNSFGQLSFVERFELESQFQENDFMIINKPGGLIAFRSQPEKGFNLRNRFQYFLTDHDLKSDSLKEIRIKDNFDLVGYDLEGNYFYALMQRGTSTIAEKYMIAINFETEEALEISLDNIYPMELKEFFVLNRNAVFFGTADTRPIVQIFDIEANNVYTVQGIYSKETSILQLRKDSELGIIDVLVSRRDKYKTKQVSILSFDEIGNKIREVTIDKLNDNNLEIVEGILTPINNYQQSVIGSFGQRRREAYQGIYIADINEFGEYNIKYYTMEDFRNFFNYLNERQRERKLNELEKSFKKGVTPSIKPVFSTREVITTDRGFLIYSDHFTATNPRYIPRDGVYANDAYRFNPNRIFFDGMNYGPAYGSQMFNTIRTNPYSWQQEGEYKFVSAYFLYVDREGQVIWENALNLYNKFSQIPGKYGELSFDGNKLHYLYLEGINLYMSYIKDGEVIFENQSFDIELLNENERIRETQELSLTFSWWYDNFYILSGKQMIRYLGPSGKEENKQVFFLTKIKVDGDLWVPEESIN